MKKFFARSKKEQLAEIVALAAMAVAVCVILL